ncbi:MAG: YbjN domain-containing protein [Actinomycetaceae bacterium]|nr:YbjN domain-containing protein [Actinomycetaceae bacterium]
MSALFSVPNNDAIPWPVDFHRLMTAVKALGLSADIVHPGRSAYIFTQGTPFRLSLDTAGRFISIRAIWNMTLRSGADCSWVFAAANSWNQKKYFPTVYWLSSTTLSSHSASEGTTPNVGPDSDGGAATVGARSSLHICADFVVDIGAGLSPVQLQDNLEVGISSGVEAIHYMQRAEEETLASRGLQ